MKELNYEIKIENSSLNIGTDLNFLNIKNMKLLSTPKVNDFNISFEDDFTNKMLYDWVKSISEINENTVFDTLECRVLTKSYPYKSKKKRLVKKWWNKHSEIRVYENVKFDFGVNHE
jgi:hypothetical protein